MTFKNKQYYLRLRRCSNWQSVLEDPVLGPLVADHYELVRQDFLANKASQDAINTYINESFNETLAELGAEPLDLFDEEALNQRISDIISDDISKSITESINKSIQESINKSIQKSIRKQMEEDYYN